MMKIIGVTGGIGSGKTTIINYIKSKGFVVYIADDAGKRVMEDFKIIDLINKLFDGKVLLENGFLHRSKIASLVFNDKDLLEKLKQIVHPAAALDFEDFIVSNIFLPLGSFIFLLFCVSKWGWGWKNYSDEVNTGKGIKLKNATRVYLTYILPLIVLFIFVFGMYDKFAG
mgnify:CR=1 FL=1